MSTLDRGLSTDDYAVTLAQYLDTHGEEALYRASLLSQFFIESGLGPEDIIALHVDALERVLEGMPAREQVRASADAHQFLLEIMVAYGVKYKEYLELKLAETLRTAEARAARDEERLLEAERLEIERDEILAVIAHEMRTPLTAAKGSLDMVTRSVSRGQLAPIPDYLGSAQRALERLSRLSADLVEASHGQPPQVELAPRDLAAIIAQACDWVRPTVAAKGITLASEGAAAPLPVLADTDALLSVFGNLLSNAVRYTPAGGRVIVRWGAADGWAWGEVQDTGIGMTPETQGRLFEKFYRAPEARRMEVHGLGLGLALVQQLVQAHAGRVEVASVPGRGSTLRVLLPLRADQGAEGGHGAER